MKPRFYFLFVFFTLIFLFYPGDSEYFKIFAYNRSLFSQNEQKISYLSNPVPYLLSPNNIPYLTAEGALVVDLPSFTPILDKNSHEKLFPASTAKIITALVSRDIYKPDDIITVKNVHVEGQVMGLVEGERITVENLLYGMLVHSGNDAAYALANHYGFNNFVDLMNKKAQSIGMKDSHFTNPAGLDDFVEYTTAYDLALAGRSLLDDSYLKKIVATKQITISDVDFKYFHQLSNVNLLLGEIQGVGGLKTGYTQNAGENLVSFYKKDGHDFILVVLRSDDRFADTRVLIGWLNTNVDYIVNYSPK